MKAFIWLTEIYPVYFVMSEDQAREDGYDDEYFIEVPDDLVWRFLAWNEERVALRKALEPICEASLKPKMDNRG